MSYGPLDGPKRDSRRPFSGPGRAKRGERTEQPAKGDDRISPESLGWFERLALGCQTRFEARRTIAVAAGPRFGAVQIAASAPCVRVLHFDEVEVLFPVLALFLERRRAIAHLDPLHASILELARNLHIAEVLVAGDRAEPERFALDRVRQRVALAVFQSRRDQVPHEVNCTAVAPHLLGPTYSSSA